MNIKILHSLTHRYTELPKYYVRLQKVVARSLRWPAGLLAGHHTAAAPKHSLCYFSSVFE